MPPSDIEPTAPPPSVAQEPEPDPLIERLRQRRIDALESALTSGTKVQTEKLAQNETIKTAGLDAGGVMGRGPATAADLPPQASPSGQDSGFSGVGSMNLFGALSGSGAERDTGLQNRKRDFLKSGGDFGELGYLDSTVVPPLSPYELKSGTVIPAVMLTGINSDLPGFITAQVTEAVHDSATGRYPLVPKGSRIVGVYDSEIAYAQNRLLVAWNKIVFPNGATLQINGMPGVDGIGQAGIEDKVNNHYWRIFGAAVLASLFSVGYELTQDRNNAQDDDVTDTVSEVVGQQIALLGVQMARKGMNIQPTIEIRPGSIIQVMVTKDMVFPGQYTAN
jgi:type IV secretion system protein VirB10